MNAQPPKPPPADPVQPVWSIGSFVLLLLNVAGLALLWVVFIFATRKFEEIYNDFEVSLPWLTRVVVELAHRPLLVAAGCLALCVPLTIAQVVKGHKKLAVVMNLIVGLGVGVFLVIYLIALFLPLPILVRSTMGE